MMNRFHKFLFNLRPRFIGATVKHALRIKRKFVEVNGVELWIDPVSDMARGVSSAEGYESQLYDTVNALLEPGDTFIDLGGNEGYFSLVASQAVGRQGTVLCLEPQQRLQSVLARNIGRNKAFNIWVFPQAISDEQGIAELHLYPDINTGCTGLSAISQFSTPKQTVVTQTLEHFTELLNLQRVKLIKIDIEGFEYEAVFGSKKVFENQLFDHIALELHPFQFQQQGKNGDDILKFLEQAGYDQNPDFKNLVFTRADLLRNR